MTSSYAKQADSTDRAAGPVNLIVGSTIDEDSARPLVARATGYRMDLESETFVIASTMNGGEVDGQTAPLVGGDGPHGRSTFNGMDTVVADTLRSEYGEQSFRSDGADNLIADDRLAVTDEVYALRSDASRDGEAHTPSADAEGNVRLRNPGFNVYTNAPTLDGTAPHMVGPVADPIGTREGKTYTHEGRNNFRTHNVVEVPIGFHTAGYGASEGDHAATLQASDARLSNQVSGVVQSMGVRRLTPLECERLQGFPDGWTDLVIDGKPIADSHRYRMLGNAVATVCAQWIGHRLAWVDATG